MANRSTALTEPGIRRIGKAPAGQRVEKFDKLAQGLCLRVNDRGRKSWVVHFRFEGKPRKLALGEWPTMPVDEARTEARRVRELADSGIDPKAQRERDKEQARQGAAEQGEALRTFADLAEQYIAREVPRLKRGRDVESVIRRQLIPEWGDRPITELRKRDAIRLTDGLMDQGHQAAALKLHEVVKRLFRWAAQRDEIEVSPFADLPPPAEKEPRQRTLAHAELRTLWAACEREGYPWGELLRFLLLTGARRSEAAEARWAELDSAGAPTVWTIPAERSKNGKPHRVPLSQPARELLSALPRFADGDFVFTTTGGRRPVSGFSKAKDRLDRITEDLAQGEGMSAVEAWRWHDTRRTVRTELPRLGVAESVAERVLNHAQDPLTRTYNLYAYEAEKADALERWGAELVRVVDPQSITSNVIPFVQD